ncbi:SMC family ATPase [Staphylococcus caprae]|uniref:exonuclease subunit SbcC n=1 Tax=Staphylococcus caprae TaxID=29380 RepID=UPI001C83C367|nr:exonuclease subunit SbcC [Staphylococcus caprae]MBX5318156.1 SMC family ATPase [Staphylococcus caprae]
MKPIKLQLNNFGPFLNETIDFSQIENNQLFLISGKTGSGKTMIFDAIVYALFGKASTENRKEDDLRSHFADGKSPMSVTYEFKLHNQIFKVHREAPFIKEGNTTKTHAKLDIYEQIDHQYELKESRVNAGNQFIVQLMGVNAEQFRQLFILPQGEFKKFLQSNSKDKQSILRTLFNSERFEEIRSYLMDSVKNEKLQIENRYNQINHLWNSLATYENDNLSKLKEIDSSQTDKIIQKTSDFIEYGKQLLSDYKDKKISVNKEVEEISNKYNLNKELKRNIEALNQQKEQFENLKKEQNKIKELKVELNKINESNILITSFKREQVVNSEIEELKLAIEKAEIKEENFKKKIRNLENEFNTLQPKEKEFEKINDYLKLNTNFYNNADTFIKSYNRKPELIEEIGKLEEKHKHIKAEKENLLNQSNGKTRDYEIIDQYSQQIVELKKSIEDIEKYLEKEKQFKKIQRDRQENNEKIKEVNKKYSNIKSLIAKVDATNVDLNDKQTFIEEIKSALSIGDTCPICGNEIQSLGEHIDFESIAKKKEQIEELENNKTTLKETLIRLESGREELKNRESELDFQVQETQDIETLKAKLAHLEDVKSKQQEENKFLESINEKEKNLDKSLHELDLEINNKKAQLEQINIRLNDFEASTEFDKVSTFKDYYEKRKEELHSFNNHLEDIKNQLTENKSNLTIELNNVENFNNNLEKRNNEKTELENNIEKEMKRIGFETYEQIEETIELSNQKQTIEEKINKYNLEYQNYEFEIKRLEKLVNGKELSNIEDIEAQLINKKQELDEINSEIATIDYKNETNLKNIKQIKELISILNDELKEQQEIFLLTEILSGKNSHKLTLENYVLIYYLEKIIFQANQRLLQMSGNRYQLVRREAISQGFSGLEIDVFDFHSNKSRHISSLSGGETFQASLALALGLSEIVQQESGGITLESMFIDEGFGTLDQETLETALDTLINLRSSGRMVGIISHVSELKQRIPLILEVSSNQYQSNTQFKRN